MPALTKKRMKTFLKALCEGGSVSEGAKKAGVGRTQLYKKRKENKEFEMLWEDALEQGTDFLEDVAKNRAVEGSDTLLIFLLKGRRPEKFRERFDIDQKVSATLEVSIANKIDSVYGEDGK